MPKEYITDEKGVKRDKATGVAWNPNDDIDEEEQAVPATLPPWLPTAEQYTQAIKTLSGIDVGSTAMVPQNPADAAREHIAAALKLIFPEDCWDDSVDETARRVLGFWTEYVPEVAPTFNFTTFEAAKSQMILVGDIEFASVCAHHLLPFTGKVHVGYIANGVQVGLSKIPRLVEFWAKRPQVQEGLTAQILSDLKTRLNTKDVIVVCEARHTCVSARGTRLHNGVMRTSLPSGLFMSSPPAREEFFALLARDGV